MASLGIGLIGTGFMGKCHALAWNTVATVFGDVDRPRLAMLAEASQELAERKARELGFERATGDWRALITDPAVDVVSITTPNAFHPEMAIAALEAGKHVWCEKPMATTLADAERMLAAARASGKVAALGYNYIQNPIIRLIRRILDEGQIGTVNHIRLEMDEDFMADPEDFFFWKSEAVSGHGALDDFGVHPLSLVRVLFGGVRRVCGHMAKPYADRPVRDGGRREVETYDIATTLIELENGVSGSVALNRSAWGRKGRIFVQIFGSKGTIVYDQERMNEVQLYTVDGPKETQGFRTILTGPQHPPYDRFIPAPGHSLGFNDLKIIECHELIRRIAGEAAHLIEFEDGIFIERTVDAIARSAHEERWVEVVREGEAGSLRRNGDEGRYDSGSDRHRV
jgi:predicted dehydrogenase